MFYHSWGVEGKGAHRFYTANIWYTFPLEFAELVWCDGTHVGRKKISLTGTFAFETKSFKIPFDATGKKRVRYSVWESAGDGAYVQPTELQVAEATSESTYCSGSRLFNLCAINSNFSA